MIWLLFLTNVILRVAYRHSPARLICDHPSKDEKLNAKISKGYVKWRDNHRSFRR